MVNQSEEDIIGDMAYKHILRQDELHCIHTLLSQEGLSTVNTLICR